MLMLAGIAGAIAMKNDYGPLNTPFLAGLSIGIAVGIFVLLIAPAFTTTSYCVAGEPPLGCMREWLMMAATLAAAVAGGWAAFYVARTLRETMRQTRFIVGDELPTLELLPNAQQVESGRFRVVNWNRRPFFICEARWFTDLRVVPMDVVECNGEAIRIEETAALRKRIKIDGWENRSDAPPSIVAEFGIIIDIDNDDDRNLFEGTLARLEIVGFLSAERRWKVTLEAHAPLLELDLA